MFRLLVVPHYYFQRIGYFHHKQSLPSLMIHRQDALPAQPQPVQYRLVCGGRRIQPQDPEFSGFR